MSKKAETYEAVNISEEVPRLVHNVLGHMLLGKNSKDSQGEEARLVVRVATQIFGEFNLCDFNWLWKKLDVQGFKKRVTITHNKFDAWVEKIITEREELRNTQQNVSQDEKEMRSTLLDSLLDALEDKSSVDFDFSRFHIKALITDLFAAGIDNLSISMEWALAELINHPEVLKKAREEIDRVVGNERLVEELDVAALPYIQAIIKETFRLHPSLCFIARQCVKQCRVGKYVIPENTNLFVNLWAIARDPNVWENPFEFMPERFLELDGSNKNTIDVRGQHIQFLPFGYGRRICPGTTLTMVMLPALLADMIQCFDWKVTGGTHSKNTGKEDNLVQMDERPGLTTPRAYDLVLVPVNRDGTTKILA